MHKWCILENYLCLTKPKFYDALFVKDSAGVETDAIGLDVEILYACEHKGYPF